MGGLPQNDPTYGKKPKETESKNHQADFDSAINKANNTNRFRSNMNEYQLFIETAKTEGIENFRGLVVSCPINISGKSIHIVSTNLDPQDLGANLLFWDKLDWPTNNAIGIGLDGDAEFLMAEKILQQSRVHFQGSGGAEHIFLNSHLSAFKALDRQQPGSWSLSRGANSVSFDSNDLEAGRGVLVSLYGSLPVPNYDVPLAEILEFKRKRADELLTLRSELEGLYQQIISSDDSDQAFETSKSKLEIALADNLKASKEFPITWKFTDLKAKLNINAGMVGGMLGSLAGQKFGLPMLGPILGATAGFVQIEVTSALKWRQKSVSPYEYINSYHRDLFGRSR